MGSNLHYHTYNVTRCLESISILWSPIFIEISTPISTDRVLHNDDDVDDDNTNDEVEIGTFHVIRNQRKVANASIMQHTNEMKRITWNRIME